MHPLNPNSSRLLVSALWLALLSFPPGLAAQNKADRQQPAEIAADRVTLNNQQQFSHYQGHVEFKQGSLLVSGDDAKLYTSQGVLQRLEIHGQPATFQQLDDAGQLLRGKALSIDYQPNNTLVKLRDQAVLCRAGEYFRAASIDYHTDSQSVEAGHDNGATPARVVITLPPATDNNTTATPQRDCAELQ